MEHTLWNYIVRDAAWSEVDNIMQCLRTCLPLSYYCWFFFFSECMDNVTMSLSNWYCIRKAVVSFLFLNVKLLCTILTHNEKQCGPIDNVLCQDSGGLGFIADCWCFYRILFNILVSGVLRNIINNKRKIPL